MNTVTGSGFLNDIQEYEESGFLNDFYESDFENYDDEELGKFRLRLPKIKIKKFQPLKRLKNAITGKINEVNGKSPADKAAAKAAAQVPTIIPGQRTPADYKKIAIGVGIAAVLVIGINKLT